METARSQLAHNPSCCSLHRDVNEETSVTSKPTKANSVVKKAKGSWCWKRYWLKHPSLLNGPKQHVLLFCLVDLSMSLKSTKYHHLVRARTKCIKFSTLNIHFSTCVWFFWFGWTKFHFSSFLMSDHLLELLHSSFQPLRQFILLRNLHILSMPVLVHFRRTSLLPQSKKPR